MGIDRTESARRGQSTRKQSITHPYAAIEHRVIDSLAYKTLTFASRALLYQMARQLTKDNNGHLQATEKYLSEYGFGSDRTITRSIKELIARGLIYRTRCGGYQNGASKYAVTWLPIKQREGLFLEGFRSCAWRNWEPEKNNLPPAKIRSINRKNGGLEDCITAKSTADTPRKITDIELIPCVPAFNALTREAHNIIHFPKKRAHWAPVSNIG